MKPKNTTKFLVNHFLNDKCDKPDKSRKVTENKIYV